MPNILIGVPATTTPGATGLQAAAQPFHCHAVTAPIHTIPA